MVESTMSILQLSIVRKICRGVCVKRLTNGSGARRGERRYNSAFSVVELIVVIAVILILSGLILAIVGYVQNKGARSRAESEIAALSAALENYKADNGIYPRGKSATVPPGSTYTVATTGTDDLDARVNTDPSQKIYQDASRYLYEQLSGDTNLDLLVDPGNKSYFAFKQTMLVLIVDPSSGNVIGVSHIKDPFGNTYGYSTANQANPTTKGYNPTFDLWSTAAYTPAASPTSTPQDFWIKNW
jgi:type II secretory pathway pseudopilin PulG